MAEIPGEDPTQRQNTGLPLPPPFWKEFTPRNIERYEGLRTSYFARPPSTQDTVMTAGSNDLLVSPSSSSDNNTRTATAGSRDESKQRRIPLSELPPELINLQPPPLPTDGKWRCFGDLFTLSDELPSLEEQNIERVIPEIMAGGGANKNESNSSVKDNGVDGDRTDGYEREMVLKRCAKSLLANFLEMISLMTKDPFAGHEKAQDLRTLFINFHHAINEYRPHQARESLVALMQNQLDRMRSETQANREAADKARRMLEGLASIKIPDRTALFPNLFSGLEDNKDQTDEENPEEVEYEKEELVWRKDCSTWNVINGVEI